MGRIAASVKIENPADPEKRIRCDALVDTGASHMILPSAWRDRLGDLEVVRQVKLELATQASVDGTVCGPVRIQIEGFEPLFSEVIFVDMQPEDSDFAPLVGYIVLEQSQAAVDLFGHRLVHVKRLDLKGATGSNRGQKERGSGLLSRTRRANPPRSMRSLRPTLTECTPAPQSVNK